MCKIDRQWEFAVSLCDNLEGCDRVGGGSEVQQGREVYVPMADSC